MLYHHNLPGGRRTASDVSNSSLDQVIVSEFSVESEINYRQVTGLPGDLRPDSDYPVIELLVHDPYGAVRADYL